MKDIQEERYRSMLERLSWMGQTNLRRHLEGCREEVRERLLDQLDRIPWDLLPELVANLRGYKAVGSRTVETDLRPARTISAPDLLRYTDEYERGCSLLAAGRIALLTVAGGQATRLGTHFPKGMLAFPVLRPEVTLFQWFADSVRAVGRDHKRLPHWVIMLNPLQLKLVQEFFAAHHFFDLPTSHVHFVCQSLVPTLDEGGQLMCSDVGELLLNPNGHGGVFEVLQRECVCDALEAAGVTHFVYHQVDNPLAPVFDPAFLQACIDTGDDFVSAAVPRNPPDPSTGEAEKVGVFAERHGRTCVLEYSELGDDMAHAQTAQGGLLYDAANIALHVMRLAWVRTVRSDRLPIHWARKIVERIPGRPPVIGYKAETFVFDALDQCDGSQAVLMLSREQVFAPIKNASGADSPDACRAALAARSLLWLEAQGAEELRDAHGRPKGMIEIYPNFALAAPDLRHPARRSCFPRGRSSLGNYALYDLPSEYGLR